jgi:OOP family OmpA-OmpF porin
MGGLGNLRGAARWSLIRLAAYALAWSSCALLLGACGSGSHKRGHTSTAGSSTSASGGSGSRYLQPLAAAQDETYADDNYDGLRVSIYDLRRSGPFVILDFTIQCVRQQTNGNCATEFDLAPSQTAGNSAVEASLYRSGGLSLIDPAAAKQYRVVTGAQNRPETSLLPFEIRVGSGPLLAWAKFPAPPANVTSVDVTFPNGGPQIPNIPISSAKAPAPSRIAAGVAAPQPATGVQPADATSSTGLTLPVVNLVSTVGNPNGAESDSSGRSTITLRSDVLFRFNKSNLTSGARTILTGVAQQIAARARGPVQITGYTDSIGTDAVNIPLSRARASSVLSALKPLIHDSGVSFQASGQGSADPVAPNTKADGSDNPPGRALNRRVTIAFAVKAPARPKPPPAPVTSGPGVTTSAHTVSFTATSPGSDTANTSGYQVTVDQLYRDGGSAVLQLAVTCQNSTVSSSGCSSGYDFAGTPTVPPLVAETTASNIVANAYSAGAFYLVDPATGTEYIPLYDPSKVAVTTTMPQDLPVGKSYPVWLYYPAPPAGVTTMTVVLPGGGVRIGGVPLQPAPSGG